MPLHYLKKEVNEQEFDFMYVDQHQKFLQDGFTSLQYPCGILRETLAMKLIFTFKQKQSFYHF